MLFANFHRDSTAFLGGLEEQSPYRQDLPGDRDDEGDVWDWSDPITLTP